MQHTAAARIACKIQVAARLPQTINLHGLRRGPTGIVPHTDVMRNASAIQRLTLVQPYERIEMSSGECDS